MKKEQRVFIDRVMKHWYLSKTFNPDVCLFIACQFALESAFGNSDLAVCYHNFCGMKVPTKRYGKYLRNVFKNQSFARYLDFDNCVIDYVCWVLYFRPSVTNLASASHYAKWIENRFCPEKDYVDKIVSLYNQFKNAD